MSKNVYVLFVEDDPQERYLGVFSSLQKAQDWLKKVVWEKHESLGSYWGKLTTKRHVYKFRIDKEKLQ
jgi:hypothetical protein